MLTKSLMDDLEHAADVLRAVVVIVFAVVFALALVGCGRAPEDLGAVIVRECTAVVKVDYVQVEEHHLVAELHARGVVIPRKPESDGSDELARLLRERHPQTTTAADRALDVERKAYDAARSALQESEAYRVAYAYVEAETRAQRVKACITNRARAFESGSRAR